jgi:hypothetical protein
MPDELRTCETCGSTFTVTEKELESEETPRPGLHLPVDCPEDLDTFCPGCDPGITECKSCRPKQDMQRA